MHAGDDKRLLGKEALEAGLRAGYRAPDTGANTGSVLTSLARFLGEAPGVLLRDEEAPSGPPVRSPDEDLRASLHQGRASYQLLGEIARGGMGVILKGHDTDLGRDVALKVLHSEYCESPDALQRFVEEAQIGGQLQHPGIVPVYELGLMADERPYFTMKLIKGRTLASLLRGGGEVDRRRLLSIFEQIAQTMAYAHSRGVIHRDLKPANVMVGAFGEVQVVDWGLAKVLANDGVVEERTAQEELSQVTVLETVRSGDGSSHSRAGSVMGTPAYMSPEQARGEVAKVDERTDVFALGAILCEVLTGKPPYVGAVKDTLRRAAEADQDEAHTRLDACDADAALVQLVRACLAPAPSARPGDASVVARLVQAYLAGVEERARRAEVEAAEARAKARAERSTRRLAVALALFAAVSAAGYWSHESSERDRRERLEESVQAELQEASRAYGAGEGAVAVAALGRAEALTTQGEVRAALRSSLDTLKFEVDEAQRVEQERAQIAARDERLITRLERASLLEVYDPLEQLHGRAPKGHEPLPWESGQDRDQWRVPEDAYRAAFEEYGIDVGSLDEPSTITALRASRSPQTIAVFLDDWTRVRERAEDPVGADEIRTLVRAVDPDPWRGRLRAAQASGEVQALLELARAPDLVHQDATTVFLLGQTLRRHGQLEAAQEVLEGAMERDRSDFRLRFELSMTLSDAAKHESALVHAEAAVALRPSSTLALGRLARSLRVAGDTARAIRIARLAHEMDPDDVWSHREFAWSLWEEDQVRGWAEIQEVLQRHRRDVLTWEAMLWFARMSTPRPDSVPIPSGGAQFHRRVLVLDPGAALRVAPHLERMGDIEGATRAYRQALLRTPQDVLLLCSLAMLLAGSDDPGEAAEGLTIVDRVLDTQPDALDASHGEALQRLAYLLDEAGEPDAAAGLIRLTLAAEPESDRDQLLAFLGRVDRDAPEPKQLEDDLRAALRHEPDEVITLRRLATFLEELDTASRIAESLELQRHIVRLEPDHAPALHSLAWDLVKDPERTGFDPEEALAHARSAVALRPDSTYYLNTLCHALYHLSHWRELAQVGGRSIEICRDLPDPPGWRRAYPDDAYMLAAAHHHLGDSRGAAEALAQARRIRARRGDRHARLAGEVGESLRADLEGAIRAYRQELLRTPDDTRLLCSLAMLVAGSDDPEEAAEGVRLTLRVLDKQAEDPDPARAEDLHRLAHVLREAGETLLAVDLFRQTLVLEPEVDREHLHDWLAVIFDVQQEDELREALRRAPDDVAALGRLAAFLESCVYPSRPQGGDASRIAESLELKRHIVRLEPDEAPALNSLAWDLVKDPERTGFDAEEALDLARRAVALRPDSTAYLNTLCHALYHLSLWTELAQVSAHSIAIADHEDKDPYADDVYMLSAARHHVGDVTGAVDALARARQLHARQGDLNVKLAAQVEELVRTD